MPRRNQSGMMSNGGSRPVPDPTILTTQLVDRGIAGLREILESKAEGDKKELEARLEGMDRAVKLLQTIFDRLPAEIAKEVNALRELHGEKFSSIQTQFKERDTRTEQTQKDSKTAVDAALQAAKEAVGKQNEASDRAIQKSEVSTSKEIDGLKDIMADVKDRMNRLEGEGRGAVAAKTTQQTSNTSLVGIIGLIIGTIIGLGGLLIALAAKP
jgi:hypothetical protein